MFFLVYFVYLNKQSENSTNSSSKVQKEIIIAVFIVNLVFFGDSASVISEDVAV